jgi:hypothetical protein
VAWSKPVKIRRSEERVIAKPRFLFPRPLRVKDHFGLAVWSRQWPATLGLEIRLCLAMRLGTGSPVSALGDPVRPATPPSAELQGYLSQLPGHEFGAAVYAKVAVNQFYILVYDSGAEG